ncbi:hypothetical protein SK128_013093, partial [Halocaridina rubra]
MIAYLKCFIPNSASVLVVLCISLLNLLFINKTNAKAFDDHERIGHLKVKRSLEDSVVYPMHGIPTGPPLESFDESQMQRFNSLSNAQVDPSQKVQDSKNITGFPVPEKSNRRSLEKAQSQLLKEPLAKSLPLRGSCVSGVSSKNKKHPLKDTVELYEALGNVLEHVMGIEQPVSDPEEMRMRAFVLERQSSLGVEVVLQKETHFWERHRNEENPSGSNKDDSPSNKKDFSPRREHYVEDDAINEQQTQITVHEGSRLRLVCNVTGLQSYK